MKKFLLLSAVLGLSIPAFAQMNNDFWDVEDPFAVKAPSNTFNVDNEMVKTKTTNGLTQANQPTFDVDPFGGTQLKPKQMPESDVQPVVKTPSVQGGGLFPELGETQSKQKPQGSESIKLIIDKVRIVQPAFNGMAFCMGKMTLENNLNVRIQKLDVTLNYGGLDVPLSFVDIPALGGTKTEDIAWATDYCNSMLDVPRMTVTTCVASTLTKEQCQAKLQYKPIEGK